MSASVSKTAGAAGAKAPGALIELLSASWKALVSHFVHRAAIATLRELDDRALRDIGLRRTEIQAAVYGLVSPVDRERMS